MAKTPTIAHWDNLINASRDASRERKWKMAMRDARAALTLSREQDCHLKQAEALLRVAECAVDTGEVAVAKRSVTDSLRLLEQETEPSPLLIACADLYIRMGLFTEAKDLLNQHILAHDDISVLTSQALLRLGCVWLGLEEPNRALVHFEESARVARKVKAREELLVSMRAQAYSHDLMGNYSAAIRILRFSCEQAKRFGMNLYAGASLFELADLYKDLGNIVWAKQCLAEVESLYGKDEPHLKEYIAETLLETEEARERRCDRVIRSAINITRGRKNIAFNRDYLLALRKKLMALSALSRHEEAQETAIDILDTIGTAYDQHWPLLETVLSQLAVALNGLNRPEVGEKAEVLSNRIYAIRSNKRSGSNTKNIRLKAVSEAVDNFIRFFRTGRTRVFSIRGRTVNFETGAVTGKGLGSPKTLTPYERIILQCLIAYQGQECSVMNIARQVYPGADNDPARDWRALLKPHVTNLRKKLLDDRGGSLIRSITHVGWCLATE